MSGPSPMPPHNPALGGATAGMAGPAQPPLLMHQAQVAAKMVGEVVMAIRRLPGVDAAKVQQGAQLLQQGMQTILGALPKQAGPGVGATPGGAPVPPGGAPPVPPMR